MAGWSHDSVKRACPMFEVVDAIAYLDLTLSFGKRWENSGLMDVKTYTKPSAVKTPLAHDSWHTAACLKWWPLTEAKRHARNCTSFADFHSNVQTLAARLQKYPGEIRRAVTDKNLHLRRPALIGRRGVGRHTPVTTQSASNITNITFVIKHDEIFSRMGIKSTISECLRELNSRLSMYLERHITSTIAWSCHAKHCRILLRKHWPTGEC